LLKIHQTGEAPYGFAYATLIPERLRHFRNFSVQFRFASLVSLRLFRFVRFLFAYDFQCFASKRNKRKTAFFSLRSETSEKPPFFRFEAKNFSLPFRLVSLRSENERRTLLWLDLDLAPANPFHQHAKIAQNNNI
jgi:hypothetical protein